MGVMACDRKDCGNIMCDTYMGTEIGYICWECIAEFKICAQAKKIKTEGKMKRKLKKFMLTSKGDYKTNEIDVDNFFKNS